MSRCRRSRGAWPRHRGLGGQGRIGVEQRRDFAHADDRRQSAAGTPPRPEAIAPGQNQPLARGAAAVATLKESILALVRSSPGLTDREIANRLLGSRAALARVNQPARSLAAEGLIARRCRYDGKIGNHAAEVSQGESSPAAGGESIEVVDPLSEGEVKRKLQAWLDGSGWNVVVTWGRSQGINIDARQSGRRWVIEAKGRGSLNPRRANYFLEVLGELLQLMRDSEAKYSVALPDLPKFRRLWNRVPDLAKRRTGISALFVNYSGRVREVVSK